MGMSADFCAMVILKTFSNESSLVLLLNRGVFTVISNSILNYILR